MRSYVTLSFIGFGLFCVEMFRFQLDFFTNVERGLDFPLFRNPLKIPIFPNFPNFPDFKWGQDSWMAGLGPGSVVRPPLTEFPLCGGSGIPISNTNGSLRTGDLEVGVGGRGPVALHVDQPRRRRPLRHPQRFLWGGRGVSQPRGDPCPRCV